MKYSKYNVSKDKSQRTYNDIVFDSKMEMMYYRDVILPAYENGDIIYYERQKKYELQPKFKYQGKTIRAINYVADYYIVYADSTEKVIDIKGLPDAVAPLKKKLFMYKYPEIDYVWLTYVNNKIGWIEYDEANKMKKKENLK